MNPGATNALAAAGLDAAPDYIEPLRAWRVWRVVEQDGALALASVVKGTVWPAGEPLCAECLKSSPLLAWLRRRQPHEAPAERCECGIYAADIERSGKYLKDSLPAAIARVLGSVALWGSIVECERGYRATYAYPLALYVPADAGRDSRVSAAQIADGLGRYGVPVEILPGETRHLRLLGRDESRSG